MSATLGSQVCCDVIEAARWARHAGVDPSGWEGKANGYACGVGVEPGEGNVLLRRWQLRQLAGGRQDLSIQDPYDLVIEYNGRSATIKALYVVAAVSCHPSPSDDDNALYHVRLADVRYLLAQYVLSKGYNLRETPTGNYQLYTTYQGAGSPWTWAQVNADIWSYFGVLTAEAPTAPPLVGAPQGTPDELDFYAKDARTAYGLFLDRLALALAYDPATGKFSIVKPGAADAAFDQAAKAWPKLDDAGPVEPVPGRVPASVRVLFRKEPERAYGNNPWYEVSVADTSPSPGVVPNSEEILLDDLIADYPGGLVGNVGDLQTRAAARATEFFVARKHGAARLQSAYSGAIADFKPGSQAKVVAWRDAGRGEGPLAGVTTEVLRYPPDPVTAWPSTPPQAWRQVEEVEVLLPTSGATLPAGYMDAVVRRWNASTDKQETLFKCWAKVPNNSTAPPGHYPTALFGGFKDNGAGDGRPVYLLGCCPDGTDVGAGPGDTPVSWDDVDATTGTRCWTCSDDLGRPYKVPQVLRITWRPTVSSEWRAKYTSGVHTGEYVFLIGTIDGGATYHPLMDFNGPVVFTPYTQYVRRDPPNGTWFIPSFTLNPGAVCHVGFPDPADQNPARLQVNSASICCSTAGALPTTDSIGQGGDHISLAATVLTPNPVGVGTFMSGTGYQCRQGVLTCGDGFSWTRIFSLNPLRATIVLYPGTIAIDLVGYSPGCL